MLALSRKSGQELVSLRVDSKKYTLGKNNAPNKKALDEGPPRANTKALAV